jgi:hypothetical protein
MKKVFIAATIIAIIGTIISCSKTSDYTPDCSTTKSYATDVSPVITSTCATNSGCHAAGSSQGPGALTNYQQVFNNRSAIRSSVASGMMPQDGSLSASQKNALLCWIDNGAPNN